MRDRRTGRMGRTNCQEMAMRKPATPRSATRRSNGERRVRGPCARAAGAGAEDGGGSLIAMDARPKVRGTVRGVLARPAPRIAATASGSIAVTALYYGPTWRPLVLATEDSRDLRARWEPFPRHCKTWREASLRRA